MNRRLRAARRPADVRPFTIERGKTYVLEADRTMTVSLAERMMSQFERVTGAKLVVIVGGHIAGTR